MLNRRFAITEQGIDLWIYNNITMSCAFVFLFYVVWELIVVH